MKVPLISVIIPVYNVEKYLSRSIESCINQTLREIEIIIVNDGSPDNSQDIIDFYANADNRIRVVNKSNEGVTLARKDGLKIANGDFIFYLDADDYIVENALELLHAKAVENDADWVVGDFLIKYEGREAFERRFDDFGVVNSIGFLKYAFTNRDFYFTGRLIRAEVLKNTQLNIPSDITYGEDNLAVVQLGYAIKKAIKLNVPILYYVQRTESVTNQLKIADIKKRAKAIDLIEKFINDKKLYDILKEEFDLYILNEINYSLMNGYADKVLASKYLKNELIQPFFKKKKISIKQYFIFRIAQKNIDKTVQVLMFLKKIKKLINK